jgi:hypothetical protein
VTSGTGPLHHTCRARHPLAKQSLSCANTEAGPPQHSRPPEKRGWAAYFRFGNSADRFGKIIQYARMRLALFVAKRARRSRKFGWAVLACRSPDQLGLITLSGIVVAPYPFKDWRVKPNAAGERRR